MVKYGNRNGRFWVQIKQLAVDISRTVVDYVLNTSGAVDHCAGMYGSTIPHRNGTTEIRLYSGI